MRHFRIVYQGKTYEIDAEEIGAAPAPAPERKTAEPPAPAGSGQVLSPISGQVMDVPVSNGQTVREGDVLVVLDAMKMEVPVCAERSGTVTGVAVKKGDFIEMQQPLMSIS